MRNPRYRWLIFAVLMCGYVVVFFQRMAPATVATDMMRDLATREGMMGILSAMYFYPHALMNIPAGILADKWGAKRTISAFFVVACIGSIIFALSHSVLFASVGRLLVGAGMAMLFVPALKIFSNWFHGKEFAFVTGLFVSSGGIGSLLATTPLAIATTWLGWRASFAYVGLLTLLIGLLAAAFVVDQPRGGPKSATHPSGADIWKGVMSVVTNRSFPPLAGWFFFCNGLFFTFAGLWAGPYLEQVYELDKPAAGNVLSMIAVGIAIGGALLSSVSNRLHDRRHVLIFSTSVILALFSILNVFLSELSIGALYVLYLLFGIFGNGVVAIGFTITKETFPAAVVGTAIGLVNVFGFLGAALMQPAVGFLLQNFGDRGGAPAVPGYRYAFLAFLLCSGICVLMSCLLRRTPAKDGYELRQALQRPSAL